MRTLGIGLFVVGTAALAASMWTADAGNARYTYDVDCQDSEAQDQMDAKIERLRRPQIVPGMI